MTRRRRDLHDTDAHADVEDLVLPDEAVVADRTHHVVRDLPCLLERATDQQQREFIAASRPTVSESRTASLMIEATSRAFVAGRVPAVSFTTLNRVRSDSTGACAVSPV